MGDNVKGFFSYALTCIYLAVQTKKGKGISVSVINFVKTSSQDMNIFGATFFKAKCKKSVEISWNTLITCFKTNSKNLFLYQLVEHNMSTFRSADLLR